MGRRPRIHFSGAVYHAMARGVDGRAVFTDDHERTTFLEGLQRITADATAEVLAYCLMGNHFHLAIQVGAVPLSVIMQRLLTGHAKAFNPRHERCGHLFQSRYKAIICPDEGYLAVLIHYIHQNPVRAGIVLKAEDWPWSSVRTVTIAEADYYPPEFDPWFGLAKETVDLKRFIDAPKRGIDEIGNEIGEVSGISLEELRSGVRRRPVIAARCRLTREAIRNGHALTAVAAWLNATKSAVTRYSRGNTATTGTPDT